MTDSLLRRHRLNRLPGDLTGPLLGTIRLLGAPDGPELDHTAWELSVGLPESAQQLLMFATNAADQRGHFDVVVSSALHGRLGRSRCSGRSG
ncbi:hypothetical protein GCM10020358_72260 [Amorphoplanes nipponensis]|nr:hypothetical protein [Actinoplanes nipponensis]